jgi:hypothetical protein
VCKPPGCVLTALVPIAYECIPAMPREDSLESTQEVKDGNNA